MSAVPHTAPATALCDDAAAIALLEELVRIPSISGAERAAVHYLVEQMTALGFAAHIDGAGNAVGSVGDGRSEIVLLGHIDTVPGGVPVRVVDGRLYGRGAVDAKGPLAAFVSAVARLNATGRVRGRLVVIGCVEEEAPSSRGAHYAVEHYQPDACVVGEPSGWSRVTLGYKGTLRLRCRTTATCGHSAHDRQTAAERMSAFWQRILEHATTFNRGRERAFDQLLPTLLQINSSSDGLREAATAEISIRLPLEVVPEFLVDELHALDALVELEVLGATPAYQAERNTPLTRALTRAIRHHGQQPGFVLKTGTADMNIVGPRWGCPVVAYGPGDAALDHTPDEHIVLDEYLSSIRVLETALAELWLQL